MILLELEVKIKERANILLFHKEAFHFLEECKPRLSETKGGKYRYTRLVMAFAPVSLIVQ